MITNPQVEQGAARPHNSHSSSPRPLRGEAATSFYRLPAVPQDRQLSVLLVMVRDTNSAPSRSRQGSRVVVLWSHDLCPGHVETPRDMLPLRGKHGTRQALTRMMACPGRITTC